MSKTGATPKLTEKIDTESWFAVTAIAYISSCFLTSCDPLG